MEFAGARAARSFAGYEDLWRWSVTEVDDFWGAIWEYFDVRAERAPSAIRVGDHITRTRWFPGALVNYAEHAVPQEGPQVAIMAVSDSRQPLTLTRSDLRSEVARVRSGLLELGVGPGDRVASYLPNIPETIIAFLATASIGAVWTACAPEFGPTAVIDRFAQVKPKVLLCVEAYRFGDKVINRRAEISQILAGVDSVTAVVAVPYGEFDGEKILDDARVRTVRWDRWGDRNSAVEFSPVDASHPLYILYSSGTTGKPKPIIHGHGGILLEHLKVLGLHADLGPQDRFLWQTTTGWMMWNYMVSALLHGAAVVTIDIDLQRNGPSTLWKVASDLGVTWLGLGAPFIVSSMRAGLRPRAECDMSALRAIGSTGSPLPAPAFHWVYEAVGRDVLLSSISGGTDICSAFVGGNPLSPVWAGEISCRYLGAAVESFSVDGRPRIGEQGELVVTQPMPSMPIGFWGDADGSRYRAAYFERFEGFWTHGDWITITERGSCVITGRSDATLNRAGIRVGTAEIYSVLEGIGAVEDSLIVHIEDSGEREVLVLFVAARRCGANPVDPSDLAAEIRHRIRSEISPRHVPDEIHMIDQIPRTLSGKKPEVPVKRILMGADPDAVLSRDSLTDPDAIDAISQIARSRHSGVTAPE